MRVITAITITLLVTSCAMAQTVPAEAAAGSRSTPLEQHADQANFLAFLDRLDAVLQRFVNGDSDAFKDVWAHTNDVTVAGGFGGEIVQGWNLLSPRLSGVADTYSKTYFDTRRIATGATGDFGYVIQHEYFRREEAGEPYRQYRVTMLFRQEGGEWKLFHRHADGQMDFRVPD
jgi:ketosteroid isomerase-like protein